MSLLLTWKAPREASCRTMCTPFFLLLPEQTNINSTLLPSHTLTPQSPISPFKSELWSTIIQCIVPFPKEKPGIPPHTFLCRSYSSFALRILSCLALISFSSLFLSCFLLCSWIFLACWKTNSRYKNIGLQPTSIILGSHHLISGGAGFGDRPKYFFYYDPADIHFFPAAWSSK